MGNQGCHVKGLGGFPGLPGALAAATNKSHDATGVSHRSDSQLFDSNRCNKVTAKQFEHPGPGMTIRDAAEISTKKPRRYGADMSSSVGRSNQFAGVSFLR